MSYLTPSRAFVVSVVDDGAFALHFVTSLDLLNVEAVSFLLTPPAPPNLGLLILEGAQEGMQGHLEVVVGVEDRPVFKQLAAREEVDLALRANVPLLRRVVLLYAP